MKGFCLVTFLVCEPTQARHKKQPDTTTQLQRTYLFSLPCYWGMSKTAPKLPGRGDTSGDGDAAEFSPGRRLLGLLPSPVFQGSK